ncbi:MAG: ABC transporter substrate-binding protein [Cellulosilyticaceae bacterium]
MKKLISCIACITLLTMSLVGCAGGSKANDDVIRIGVYEPLTGANAAGGEMEVEGMKIANQLYPEVLGKKVELVIVDNKSDKAEATTAVARLIEKEKVSAILGSWGSSFSIAAGSLVKSNEVPAVGASCTNPLVTQDNPYYFRVCFLDPFQGTVMANYAYKNGARKVAVIQEVSNDYAVGLAKYFVDAFTALTGDPDCIVEVANYNTNDQDFSGILTNIKDKKPDMIFAPGNFTESALIIKQAKALGLEAPFIGGDTWETNEFITVGGKDVEGAVMSTFFDESAPLTEETEKFVNAYKATYPDRENVPAVSALSYDAYLIVIKAIEKAGSADPKAIRDALAETKDFAGVTGMISMTDQGDADKNMAIIKTVKDGKFVYYDTVTIEK